MRAFHLTKDYPSRYVDEFGVEKWMPNQNGMSVTGIRRQNFSEFKINKSGFNSYREFTPTEDKTEIALVGDSFIEGFHQHYYNSIGKKIENKLKLGEIYQTEVDDRPYRIIGLDDYEVFYDCLWR